MGISRLYAKFQVKTKTIRDNLWSLQDGEEDFKNYKTTKNPTGHGGLL